MLKKKILIGLISICFVFGLTGCSNIIGDANEYITSPDTKIVDFEVVDQNYWNIILRDKNTNVLYFWTSSLDGMTPIYNADGSLKVYEEETD